MNTYISYKTAKALKEFCPGLPEPMCDNGWKPRWSKYENGEPSIYIFDMDGEEQYWAYQLHDLLSRDFCEAMFKAGVKDEFGDYGLFRDLSEAYRFGGLLGVEAELMKMMGAK